MSAASLVELLVEPMRAGSLDDSRWTAVLCAARAERLLASLAWRLDGVDVPARVAEILDAARADAEAGRTTALWEAEMARRALAPLGVPVVLLKGTAVVAAGLAAGQGRLIGDLDIMVPHDRLDEVEAALLAAGWEWIKPDAYDDMYYRRWMHELPPLIHATRDRMIDVHHTILPPTARPTPNAEALIASSLPLADGLRVLSPEDMVVHAVAHLFADGDLSGGLRNLWDIDRLLREFDGDGFTDRLRARAVLHGLERQLDRALLLAASLFATPFSAGRAWQGNDSLYRARLLARDGWARATNPGLRFGFYLRSHLIRMPLPLLARHLWTKWRRNR